MQGRKLQRGQALILIVFTIVALVALTGLAVDGGMAYSDRRAAQNAADSAAWGAALAHARGEDETIVAKTLTAENGYQDGSATQSVGVTVTEAPDGMCPDGASGVEIDVQIISQVKTYFAPVIGIQHLTNTVHALTLSCDTYIAPMFDGNAIVALAPHGIGFDAAGNPDWQVTGGGIFSNSSDSPSARCKGASDVSAPSLTAVGNVGAQCAADIPDTTTGVHQYSYSEYASMFPPKPPCNGTATLVGSDWAQQTGAIGSKVALDGGDMHFASGLYCVTNSPGTYHGVISGTGVTFYIESPTFSLKFNGGGGLAASAPSGTGTAYDGVLMFSEAQHTGDTLLQTQAIDLRGNGSGDVVGSIIVPSAQVTMFGNSGTAGYHSQIIAYKVDSGGTSDISIDYQAGENYQSNYPMLLRLLK